MGKDGKNKANIKILFSKEIIKNNLKKLKNTTNLNNASVKYTI